MSAYEVKAACVRAPKQGAIRALAVGTTGFTTSVNGIKQSIASSGSEATYTGVALNGGVTAVVPPRNVIITTTSHADIDAVGVVITGTDFAGNALTETITLTNGGGATDAGVRCFASVTSIYVPAQSGTGGALEFGWGAIASLEEYVGSEDYVTFVCDQAWGMTAAAKWTAITTPDLSTTGHAAANGRTSYFMAESPQPIMIDPGSAQFKVDAGASGTLRWWRS